MRAAALIFASACLMSACLSRSLATPDENGPATLVRQGKTYHAFFPADHSPSFHCGTDPLGRPEPFAGRFTPTPALVASQKSGFRKAYRRYLLAPAEEIRPDSTVSLFETEGDAAIGREVSREEFLRVRSRAFKETIQWDRQYMGFLNSRGDSILAINMVDPESSGRRALAQDWILGFDAAASIHNQVAYDLDDSVSYVCDPLP